MEKEGMEGKGYLLGGQDRATDKPCPSHATFNGFLTVSWAYGALTEC
jgi:hypothetical protein